MSVSRASIVGLRRSARVAICACLGLMLLLPAAAQNQTSNQNQRPEQKQDQKKEQRGESASSEQAKPEQKDEPLFKRKIGFGSSTTTKSSTTLGFNGIDPSGKVDPQLLAKTPSAADQQAAKKMAAAEPSELTAFLKEGGLNKK